MENPESKVLRVTLSITFDFSPTSERGFSDLTYLIDKIIQYSIADNDNCTVIGYYSNVEAIMKAFSAKQIEPTSNNI